MAFRVFLSHSSRNDDYAKFISQTLMAKGFEIFLDDYSIEPGEPIWQKIEQWIPTADVFILLLSKEAHDSPSVNQEVGMALQSNATIIPVAMEPIIPPGRISNIRTMPLYENPSGWLQWLSSHLDQKKSEKSEKERRVIWGIAAFIAGLWLLGSETEE